MVFDVSKMRSTVINLQNDLSKADKEIAELHKKIMKPQNDAPRSNKDRDNLIKARKKLEQYKEILDKRDEQMIKLAEEK